MVSIAAVRARSAAIFDREPVLKALICRHPDVHPQLPPDLDSAIAAFLGGEMRTHHLPCGAGRTDSLRAAVLAMYRRPVRLSVSPAQLSAAMLIQARLQRRWIKMTRVIQDEHLSDRCVLAVQPPDCDNVDTPVACMRYLGSLLQIGRKHSLLSTAGAVQTVRAKSNYR
jgi:hypothetical protein